MKDSERSKFSELLSVTMDTYRASLSEGAMAVWWGVCQAYPLEAVRQALDSHVRTAKFAPVPAEVVAWMAARDGHPDPEEAWALVSRTLNDESVTVFWTTPMQVAFGVAIDLQSDMVAARMAFLEVYRRELGKARVNGEAPKWQISPGTNVSARDAAVEEAVRLGRLAPQHASALLSHRGQDSASGWIAKLLEDKRA